MNENHWCHPPARNLPRPPGPPLTLHSTPLSQAVREQTLHSIDASRVAPGDATGGRKNPPVAESEISDLVGQLERYAEHKTGRGDRFGGSNVANRGAPSGRGSRGQDKWQTRPSSNPGSHQGSGPMPSSYRSAGNDDENSLVGAWDVGSSVYASSLPDSDARSVYSVHADEFNGDYQYTDRYTKMDTRMDSVSKNLKQHRKRLEDTLKNIDADTAAGRSSMRSDWDRDGMARAGKTTTGVGMFDVFAKDKDSGTTPVRSGMNGVKPGRTPTTNRAAEKWLSPGSPRPRSQSKHRPRSPRTRTEGPAEVTPFMSFVESVFGCGCGPRKGKAAA